MSPEAGNKPKKEAKPDEKSWGEENVGLPGIVIIGMFFILLSIFLVLTLVAFWPTMMDAAAPPKFVDVIYFGRQVKITPEVQLLILVLLAGAIGSMVHTIRSFTWYAGHRKLVWSWITRYILQPFVGSTLGLVFYFVIRGGFFSSGAGVQDTSTFSFVALAGLVGMFSESAVLKLKDIADTIFAKPGPGIESKPQETVSEDDEADGKK